MKETLVSIVMPVYNSANFIEESVESILAQTYQNWELWLINDNSADDSGQYIEDFKQRDSRIKSFAFSTNVGAAKARNKAIELATGRYIAFLDSDDIWYKDKLSIQIAFMQQNQLDFSYSSYDVIDEKSQKYSHFTIPKLKATYSDILKTNFIGCLTAIYNSERIGKQFMPNIAKRQDMALWLKILKLNAKVGGIQDFLAAYRVRKSSISSNKWNVASYQWKIYRDVEQLSLLKSSFYFVQYMIHGILKYK